MSTSSVSDSSSSEERRYLVSSPVTTADSITCPPSVGANVAS